MIKYEIVDIKLTSSESVLEDLLKSEELEDRQVDGRVETKSSLVGSESGVELNTVSAVDLHDSLVVLPGDTELDNTLGDGDDGKACLQLGANLEELRGLKGRDQLCINN